MKRIVFVVPSGMADNFKKQSIVGSNDLIIKTIPSAYSNLKQYVLGLSLLS